jgi:hypothetical protein
MEDAHPREEESGARHTQTPARPIAELENILRRIDGAGYKAYRDIEGMCGDKAVIRRERR